MLKLLFIWSKTIAFAFLLFLVMSTARALAQSPVYVVLWFDTEDYVDPRSDDAALRIATDLANAGVRATFKIVGEKARMLESRGRLDVIRALSHHAIGYHSNFHSLQPVHAVYLERMGMLEGAAEFERREASGITDIKRIFGVAPICYGQPGSSWAPQSYVALRHLGIPIYLDDGVQVGLNDQPFWYGGLLNIYNVRRYTIQPDLNQEEKNRQTYPDLAEAVHHLASNGGGVISTMFHPTEFVNTEFWDAVNFKDGQVRERSEWQRPRARSSADSERCFHILHGYVEEAKKLGAQFVTAQDLLHFYQGPVPPAIPKNEAAQHLTKQITFLHTAKGDWSAADLLLAVLGVEPQIVDGPISRGATTYRENSIPKWLFQQSKADATSYITSFHRLPSEVFVGAETLSLADFTATAAAEIASDSPVEVRHGEMEFEKYFSTDPEGAFRWPIHPKNFSAPNILDLARLQGWTLKPAHFKNR